VYIDTKFLFQKRGETQMNLQSKIAELSEQFVVEVMAALRTASIEELAGDNKGEMAAAPPKRGAKASNGRLARRSEEDIQIVVKEIVAFVAQHPEGVKAEHIREALVIEKREFNRPLMMALESGQLRKTGQKRATSYFLNKGKPRAAAAKTASKKRTAPKKKAAPKKRAAAASKTSKKAVKKSPKKTASKKVLNGSGDPVTTTATNTASS
jgi:hypothetical protein